MKILMVCLGNICRSPLAEGILKHKAREQGLDWTVDSAGTSAWHLGEPPDPRSVAVAQENGIDITDQRARQIRKADLEEFDLILAMDESNYRDILRLAPAAHSSKVKMIRNFVEPGANLGVPDPYWDDNGFDRVFLMLDRACGRLIEAITPVDR